MTRMLKAGALALVCGWLLAACSQSPVAEHAEVSGGGAPAAGGTLVVTGSGSVAPLAEEIARRFETVYPGVRVEVRSGGSGQGIEAVRAGTADIGMVSRALYDGEKDLSGFTVARDGIGLIVQANNRVAPLSDEEVIALFTGRLTDWWQLGSTAGPVMVVGGAAGRATHDLFLQHFGLRDSDVRAEMAAVDNARIIDAVAGNPGAIGYVSIAAAESAIRAGAQIRLLSAGGVAASSATVRDGTFPLSRELSLVTAGAPEGLARQFIEFATSERVRDLVEARSLVPAG